MELLGVHATFQRMITPGRPIAGEEDEPMPDTLNAWRTTPTQTLTVGGTSFAYRELGSRGGAPLVLLHHFTAVLDDWDPRVIDGIAAERHVIACDNRGVGSTG